MLTSHLLVVAQIKLCPSTIHRSSAFAVAQLSKWWHVRSCCILLISSWPNPRSYGEYSKSGAHPCTAFEWVLSPLLLLRFREDRGAVFWEWNLFENHSLQVADISPSGEQTASSLHLCLCLPPSSSSPFSFLPLISSPWKTCLPTYEI